MAKVKIPTFAPKAGAKVGHQRRLPRVRAECYFPKRFFRPPRWVRDLLRMRAGRPWADKCLDV